MSGLYVILNFEDTQKSQGEPAKNTQQALTAKWQSKDIKNQVVEHRCIINQKGTPLLVDGDNLTKMREDCRNSEKVYLVMHGDPTDCKNAYANRFDGGEGHLLIGDYKMIAAFVLKLLPERKDSYNVGLIMCFGANPKNSNVEAIKSKTKPSKLELQTSFAYRLFKILCLKCSLRMTAVTREIAHSLKDNKSYVTNELELDHTIERANAHKKIIKNQGALNAQYMQYFKQDREAARKKIEQYKADKTLPAKDNFERFAKAYATWENSTEGQVWTTIYELANDRYKYEVEQILYSQDFTKAGFHQLSKYGKYVYSFQNDTLKIVNKYQQPVRGLKAGAALYEGPLL